jgi:hypothetical protein
MSAYQPLDSNDLLRLIYFNRNIRHFYDDSPGDKIMYDAPLLVRETGQGFRSEPDE